MPESTGTENSVGVVVSLKGQVHASSQDGTRELSNGSEIFEGDKITTLEDSQLEIKFADNTSLSQAENSEVNIDAYVYDADNGENSNLLLQMTKGVFRTITGEIAKQNPDNFNLKSPMALIGIRGTTVVGEVSEDGEKWGVEDIGKGHVLVVQDAFGNIQFISEPSLIIDFFKNQPIDPARELTPKELDFFKTVAPITELQGQEDADPDTENPEGFSENPNDLTPDPITQLDLFQPPPIAPYTPPNQVPVYKPPEKFIDPYTPDQRSDSDNDDDSDSTNTDPVETNDAPIAQDDEISTDEDTPIPILNTLLENDFDPDSGDSFTISQITDPSNGSIGFIDGELTYTPDENYSGTDSFSYTIVDEYGATDTATVYVNVAPVNDAPDAQDDVISVDENTPITFNALENDSDIEGPIFLYSMTSPENGSVRNNDDGSFTYTPDESFSGTDSFSYTIMDENESTDSATVTINVNAVNDPPIAQDDIVSTDEDTSETINVLDNDSDLEGPVTIIGVSNGSNGSVVDNGDGTVTYTPNPDFFGQDFFDYIIEDNNSEIDSAIVTVDIAPVNDDPTAQDDTGSTAANTAVVIDVIDNDSDIENSVNIDSVSDGSNGTVVDNGDGTVTYTPGLNFSGQDSFEYTIIDEDGGTDTATVTIDVSSQNGTNDNDVLFGTLNADVINGFMGDDTISGLEGSDLLIGNQGSDTLLGGTGIDTLEGGEGDDIIDGGHSFFDRASYQNSTNGITVSMDDPDSMSISDGEGGTDTLTNIEWIRGTDNADTFTGDGRFMIFEGGAGLDTFNPGFSTTYEDHEMGVSYWDDNLVNKPGILIDLRGNQNGVVTVEDGWGNIETLTNITGAFGSRGDDIFFGNRNSYDATSFFMGGQGSDEIHGAELNEGEEREGGAALYLLDPDGINAEIIYDGTNLTGTVTDGWGDTDVLYNITELFGSAYDDIITINSDGTYWDDWYLMGNAGNDILTGNANEESGATYWEDPAGIYVDLGGDNPNTVQIENGYAIDGWSDNDTLVNINQIEGSDFDDTLIGNDQHNHLDGEDGDDTVQGLGGDDWLHGGEGDDTIDGGDGSDEVRGDDGSDILTGGAGDDWINGGGGYDVLIGGEGYDTLDGGDGIADMADYSYYSNAPNAINVTMDEYNPDTIFVQDGFGDSDTLISIEWIRGTQHADTITGDGRFLFFEGDAGNDIITNINGASYWNDPTSIAFNLNDAINDDFGNRVLDVKDGYGGTDTLTNISEIMGSQFGDTLTGQDNVHNGFLGGGGADIIDGGAINQEFGDNGNTAIYALDTSGINAMLTWNDMTMTGEVADGFGSMDELTNINEIVGSNHNDVMTVSSSGGYEGQWSFAGWAGNDILTGSGVEGEFSGANYGDDPTGVTVNLADGYAIDGWADNDTLNDINMVIGSEFDDSIFGDDQINVFYGADGDDTFQGAGGNDYFMFTDANSVDTILDFTANSVGGENDVLQFQSWDSGFQAQGTNSPRDVYTAANSNNLADPTAHKVIGINDMVTGDWSDPYSEDILAVLNRAINFETTNENGNYDDSYLIVSNGTDSRGYFWEGDTNNDDAVNDFELRQFVELQDFSDSVQTPLLGEDNFNVA